LSVAFGRGLGLIVIIILLSLVVRNNRDKELADDTTGTIPKTDTQGSMARKDSMNMALVMNLKGAIGDLSDGDINIKVEKGVVYVDISDKLLFKSGSFSITDKATVVLGKVAKVLSGQPNIELMVEGVKPNFIVRLLEEKYGIDPKRMTAAGRGEYVPVAENNSAENRAILLFTFRE
jgi:chemotaxis protein MotB